MVRLSKSGIGAATAVLLLLAGVVWAQDAKKNGAHPPAKPAAAPSLSADEILRRAIGRAKEDEQREKSEKFLYRQRNFVEKLDGDGQVKEKEERVYEIVELDGGLFTRGVEKNGRPLEGKDLREEQKREQKWREAVAKERSESAKKKEQKKGKEEDNENVEFDEELVSKYKVQLLGQEQAAGRPAWVIAFEPKNNDLPARRRADRILNKLAGKLWIDAQDYVISRAEARLLERVRMFGGLAASINSFDLKLEQRPFDTYTWVPVKMEMAMDGRIVVRSIRQRIKTTWEAHRRPSTTAAGSRQ